MFDFKATKKKPRKAMRHLAIESLEHRMVLASVSGSEANVNAGVLATEFESVMVFDGTSGDDVFQFIGGSDEHTVILNGQSQVIGAGESAQIIFYGHGGNNTAELTGGPGLDQTELRETSAKLTGESYQVLVYTTRLTTVQSGGGQDRALFYDTTGNDSFNADPRGAVLSGTGYQHSANDFHRVYAYASDGADTAQLTGSDGDDQYTATEKDARMYGSGYYNYTRGFDEVHGDAQQGIDDRAYLHDSAGRDIFEASANESRLYGDTFDSYAHGFDRVYAFATDDLDTAIFRDTQQSDYYKVDEYGARMYGDDYYNRAIGFDVHNAYFDPNDGQLDRAAFYDSAGNDRIRASRNKFVGHRDNTTHVIWDPDIVMAQATTGRDRALVRSPGFELRLEGDWEPLSSSSSSSSRSRLRK